MLVLDENGIPAKDSKGNLIQRRATVEEAIANIKESGEMLLYLAIMLGFLFIIVILSER